VAGENADEHPSLLTEHCTLAPNVKTCDSNVSIFLSSEVRPEKTNATLRPGFAAANKMCCIAARNTEAGKQWSGRAPLRGHVDRDITSIDISREPRLHYNNHA